MILCVAKSEELLLSLDALLRASGRKPFLCLEFADAARVLAYQPVELVIADDTLDSKAGCAIIQKAHNCKPRIPVIFWTARDATSQPLNEFDPDVILSRASGTEELLRIVARLEGKPPGKEHL